MDSLEVELMATLEEYELTPVLDGFENLVRSVNDLTSFTSDVQNVVRESIYVSLGLIIISLVCLIGAFILVPENRVKYLSILTLIIGSGVMVLSSAYYLIVPQVFGRRIDWSSIDISNEIISPVRSRLFVNSLEIAVENFQRDLMGYAFYTGLIISGISVIVLITPPIFVKVTDWMKKKGWLSKNGKSLKFGS